MSLPGAASAPISLRRLHPRFCRGRTGQSAHVIVFEIYADPEAHKAHLETPHFRKYKADIREMVKSLKLVDTVPIMLGAKPK
jgi:quinol monooxygenase YgiN